MQIERLLITMYTVFIVMPFALCEFAEFENEENDNIQYHTKNPHDKSLSNSVYR